MLKQFNGNMFFVAVGSNVLRVVLFSWRISICGCEFSDPLTAKCVCVCVQVLLESFCGSSMQPDRTGT